MTENTNNPGDDRITRWFTGLSKALDRVIPETLGGTHFKFPTEEFVAIGELRVPGQEVLRFGWTAPTKDDLHGHFLIWCSATLNVPRADINIGDDGAGGYSISRRTGEELATANIITAPLTGTGPVTG